MKRPALRTVHGQPSYRITADRADAYVTRLGGMVGPVTFRVGRRAVSPMQVAPWAGGGGRRVEPPMLRALRGDWFCMPFGGNEKSYRGERYLPHGETANRAWEVVGTEFDGRRTTLQMAMEYKARAGTVVKEVSVVEGEANVYQRHYLSGFKGPMNVGHHATLRFPDREDSGVVSTSPIVYGRVFPGEFEVAAKGGYSALRAGAEFESLDRVPMKDGGVADLTRYPARRGYEDLVLVASERDRALAWTAVWFEKERFVWFALKDPKVLRSTVLWISNGGRWYAPWNGRHVNVLGLEEVTSYFHSGLAESAAANELNARGVETALLLDPERPTVVSYVFGVVGVPSGFGPVVGIEEDEGGARVVGEGGTGVFAKVDVGFVRGGNCGRA